LKQEVKELSSLKEQVKELQEEQAKELKFLENQVSELKSLLGAKDEEIAALKKKVAAAESAPTPQKKPVEHKPIEHKKPVEEKKEEKVILLYRSFETYGDSEACSCRETVSCRQFGKPKCGASQKERSRSRVTFLESKV
jgi:hypothetical protein